LTASNLPYVQELSGLLGMFAFFDPKCVLGTPDSSVTTKFAAPTGFYAPENSPTVSRKHDSWPLTVGSLPNIQIEKS
jgi:hypothetical protein